MWKFEQESGAIIHHILRVVRNSSDVTSAKLARAPMTKAPLA